MASVDQDPRNQHQPSSIETPTETTPIVPNTAQQPEAFTRTSLGEVAGRRFPTDADHPDFPDPRYPGIIPPDVAANPDNAAAREVIPTDIKKGWVKYAAIGATGLAVLGIGGYAFGFGKTKGEMDALNLNNESGADTSTSAAPFPGTGTDSNPGRIEVTTPEVPTLDAATVEQFRSDEYYTDEQRVDWAWNQLEQPTTEVGYEGMTRIQAANAKLAAIANKPGEYEYIKGWVEPSENMTGDQILSLESSIYYFATTTQELSDQDRVKVLSAAIDNLSPVFDVVQETVLSRDAQKASGTDGVSISALNNLPVESPVFRHTVLNNGYDPEGIPSKVMNTETSGTSQRFQKIYRFIDGRPILVFLCDATDQSKRASNPQNIPAI